MSAQQSKQLISGFDCVERENLYENKKTVKAVPFLEHKECRIVNILQQVRFGAQRQQPGLHTV